MSANANTHRAMSPPTQSNTSIAAGENIAMITTSTSSASSGELLAA